MKRAFTKVVELLRHRKMVEHPPLPTNTTNEDKKRSYDEDSDSSDTPVIQQSNNKRRKLTNEQVSTVSAHQHQISIKRNISNSPQSVLAALDIASNLTTTLTRSSSTNINCNNLPLLKKVPSEVILHIMTFLTCVSDYSALQTTCVQFRDLSNMDCILKELDLAGVHEQEHQEQEQQQQLHEGAVIMKRDTPEDAQRRLCKFAKALNLEAIYMLGMIRAYCYEDVIGGVSLLRIASKRRHLKSSYALGLMLRDNEKDESMKMLLHAAKLGYLPAQQEVFPASVVKSKHGELEADELSNYLDPPCLSKLLNREFHSNLLLMSSDTSHCWNPHCGRWAYKQNVAGREFNNIPNSAMCIKAKDLDPTVASVLTCINAEDINNDNLSLFSQSEVTPSNPNPDNIIMPQKVSRMKMCSSCRQAKYCSKLCQVFDWRSGRHKAECELIRRGPPDRDNNNNNIERRRENQERYRELRSRFEERYHREGRIDGDDDL